MNGAYATNLDHSLLVWGFRRAMQIPRDTYIWNKMTLFWDFLWVLYTWVWDLEGLKDEFYQLAKGIKEQAGSMTTKARKDFEAERWFDKIDSWLSQNKVLDQENITRKRLTDEIVRYDMIWDGDVRDLIKQWPFWQWEKKLVQYFAYLMARYAADSESMISTMMTSIKNNLWTNPKYSVALATMIDAERQMSDMIDTFSNFTNPVDVWTTMSDNSWLRLLADWEWLNDFDVWAKVFNDLEESRWWTQRLSSNDYQNYVWSWFGNEQRSLRWIRWVLWKLWSERLTEWVKWLNEKLISPASRKITWFTSIAPYITSMIWYKLDLDSINALAIKSNSNLPSLMKDFGIDIYWGMRLQVWDYLSKKWIKNNWLYNRVVDFVQDVSNYNSKTAWEIRDEFYDTVGLYANKEDGVTFLKAITNVTNGFQDIADIANVNAIRRWSFEMAARAYWWADLLDYRLTQLRVDLDNARRTWNTEKVREIEYNINRLKDDVNNRYSTILRYTSWYEQDYALGRWKLYDWLSWLWLQFQWWRWLSKVYHVIKYNASFGKELFARLANGTAREALQKDMFKIPSEIPMMFLGSLIQSIRYNNYLDRYLREPDRWEEISAIDEAYWVIDWLSRYHSFFQWLQSNAFTRILMQWARRLGNNLFNSWWAVDINGMQINMSNLENYNYILKSVIWEIGTQFRSITEIAKLNNMWVQAYMEDRLFKMYQYKNLYATYWDADIVYETPNSFIYYMLGASNTIQDRTFDTINRQETAQKVVNAAETFWENASPLDIYSYMLIDSLFNNSIVGKIYRANSNKEKVPEDVREYLENTIWNNYTVRNSVDSWDIWSIYNAIKDTGSPVADKISNWLRIYITSQLWDKDFLFSGTENVDDEWNYLPASEATDELIYQLGLWYLDDWLSEDQYLKKLEYTYTTEAKDLEALFGANGGKLLAERYWDKISNPNKFFTMMSESTKEWQLADLIKLAWIDYKDPLWWTVFLQKTFTHHLNNLKNGKQYVVDPRDNTIKDTKTEILKAIDIAEQRWDTALMADIKDAFFTKKWAWKKNFSKKLYIHPDWEYQVVAASNTERLEPIQDYLISLYMPYLKTTNLPSYSNVLTQSDYAVNYLATWWKWLAGDIYTEPKNEKNKEPDYSKKAILNPTHRQYLEDELYALEDLKRWSMWGFLSNHNPFRAATITAPKDKFGNYKPEEEWTKNEQAMMLWVNMYILDEALRDIETLPLSSVQKVAAYSSIIRKWWFEVMAKLETMKDDIPEYALASLEEIKRNMFGGIWEIPETIREAMIDEGSRLSWIDLRWWTSPWTGSWWGRWTSKKPKISKSDVDLLDEFVKYANKSVTFKDLPNLQPITRNDFKFTPYEQKVIKQIRWWTDQRSKSYDDSKSSKWSTSSVSKSIVYWRRTSAWSKKKGLKPVEI